MMGHFVKSLTHDEDDGALGHVDDAAVVRHANIDVHGHVGEATSGTRATTTGGVAGAAGARVAGLWT